MDASHASLWIVFSIDCFQFCSLPVCLFVLWNTHKCVVVCHDNRQNKTLKSAMPTGFPKCTPRGHWTVPSSLVSARCGRTEWTFQACSRAKWKKHMSMGGWVVLCLLVIDGSPCGDDLLRCWCGHWVAIWAYMEVDDRWCVVWTVSLSC
jgi:hypothetical protein